MRRHATTAVTPTPRRRPVWNAYLTDDAQYRLSEQQQLQRQLQQLSTAHFSSRNSAGRRRKAGATVSFQLDHDDRDDDGDDDAHKANLQSELAALEQMLEALEAETATLHHDEALQMSVSPVATHRYTPQRALHALRRQSPVRTHARYSFGNENDVTPSPRTVKRIDAPQADSASDDEGDSDDSDASAHRQLRSSRHTQSPHARVRRPVAERIDQDDESAKLSEACYKSLRISAQLAKKMDQLTRELAHERQLRLDHELKLDVLEQEVRSTRARCNYLDAKYESVLAQMDDMRNALLETHEQQQSIATTRRKTKKLATPSRSPIARGEQRAPETDAGQENQRHASNSAQY